jgi:hypothetical protein
MIFLQNDPKTIKADLESEVKGDTTLIQEKLNAVNILLNTEENQTCIRRPPSFRGPLPVLVQRYLIQKEILEDMLRAAKLNAEPAQAKPC